MSSLVEKSTGYFTSFDGTPIYYETRGSGQPIVFVYGIACLMNHWHHQANYFANNYQTILFDIRGHHKSNPVVDKNCLRMSDLAKDLLGLVQHLNLTKAHFIGHSFGVPILLQAYADDPKFFSSLCFINGFAKNPIKGMFGLDAVEPLYHFIKSQYELNPDLWNSLWKLSINNPVSMRLAALLGGFNLKLTHFKDIEVYARGVAQMDLSLFLPLFNELMQFNGDSTLEKITVPTLIISGDSDNITPQKFQEEFHEKIQNSEFMKVPYGSHCTQLDFPDYVNLRLEKFLQSVKL